MWKYVLKRIVLAFITAFIILSLTFILIQLLPYEKPLAFKENEVFGYYEKQVSLGYVERFDEPQTGYGEPLYKHELDIAADKLNGGNKVVYYYQTPVMK